MKMAWRWTIAIVAIMVGMGAAAMRAKENDSEAQARVGIERLHQLDEQTTLSDKADELAKLWDKDAVRILPDEPVEVGKAKIYADDKRWELSKHPRTLCYRAEIQDLQIHGDWAVEWEYSSLKDSSNPKPGRAKVLRVMKREPDGEWKFTHLIVELEKVESVAPMKHPCE